MVDRLKALGDSAKNFVIFVLSPILFVAGFIWYLLNEKRQLKFEIEKVKNEGRLNELKSEQKTVDNMADSALDAYERIRAEHLSGRDQGGGSSDSGPKGPNNQS